MSPKILITTSGKGTRLGNYTKYLNKSLVKIGDKPAISYIIENYPKDTEFVITVGHLGNTVEEFLKLAYPERKITIVREKKIESLVCSMLSAKSKLQCPFIFHACDTLVNKYSFPSTKNTIGVYKSHDATQYRTINANSNGEVVKLNEKGELNFDYVHIGLVQIIDYKGFWRTAEKLYKNKGGSSLSDCHIISDMLSFTKFQCQEMTSWHDIGNVDSLMAARSKFGESLCVLEKEEETIYKVGNNIIKFFNNPDIVEKRVERTSYLKGITPEITGSTKQFYKYEYIEGENLADIIDVPTFKKLLEFATTKLWGSNLEDRKKTPKSLCKKFYIEKTRGRLYDFFNKNGVVDKPEVINGEKVRPVLEMIEEIEPILVNYGFLGHFHGDFILDNIIGQKTKNGMNFKLIDWRQDFAGELEFGDIHYDMAKLMHNLTINHKIVSKNLYDVKITKKEVVCDILVPNILNQCKEVLRERIMRDLIRVPEPNKVFFLTPVIWLNMCALHEYPFNYFLYYFGKYNLHLEIEGAKREI